MPNTGSCPAYHLLQSLALSALQVQHVHRVMVTVMDNLGHIHHVLFAKDVEVAKYLLYIIYIVTLSRIYLPRPYS